MDKKTILLKFLNKILFLNNLPEVLELEKFDIEKKLLFVSDVSNISNTCNTQQIIFSPDIVNELSQNFVCFESVYEKSKNSQNCVLAVLTKALAELSDKTKLYKLSFVSDRVEIIYEQLKKEYKQTICACLRSSELRKKTRELDPTAVCICGLFEYRNTVTSNTITHMSYGDGKLKGSFNFPDPLILYNFILHSEHKDKYLFVEARTELTQAYFDFDFKLDKHGLSQYLDESDTNKFNDLLKYIMDKICEELGDYQYIYSDKTIGNGVHIYFPNKIVTKKELIDHTQRIHNQLIKENFLNLPKSENINRRVYELILDKNVCHNGLCLMYQNKNNSHYKINIEKSTYPNIPTDKLEQLILCQLRIN